MRSRSIIAEASAVATLIGIVAGGIWAAEVRYAKSAELTQHRTEHQEERRELRRDVLETHRTILEREVYQLQALRRFHGELTPLEQQHLDELQRALEHLNEAIRSLSPAAAAAKVKG